MIIAVMTTKLIEAENKFSREIKENQHLQIMLHRIRDRQLGSRRNMIVSDNGNEELIKV